MHNKFSKALGLRMYCTVCQISVLNVLEDDKHLTAGLMTVFVNVDAKLYC